jgi:hypothetical protein
LSLEVVYGVLGGFLIGDRLRPVEGLAVLLIANLLVVDAVLAWRTRRLGR